MEPDVKIKCVVSQKTLENMKPYMTENIKTFDELLNKLLTMVNAND